MIDQISKTKEGFTNKKLYKQLHIKKNPLKNGAFDTMFQSITLREMEHKIKWICEIHRITNSKWQQRLRKLSEYKREYVL